MKINKYKIFFFIFFNIFSINFCFSINEIKIFSKKQIFDTNLERIIFNKDITLEYKNILIKANTIIIYKEKTKKKIIEGYGTPIIIKNLKKNNSFTSISCLKMKYYFFDKTIILSENVVLKQSKNVIFSDYAVFYLNENKIYTKSNPNKKVQTILNLE